MIIIAIISYMKAFLSENMGRFIFASISVFLLIYGHFLYKEGIVETKYETVIKLEKNKYLYYTLNDNGNDFKKSEICDKVYKDNILYSTDIDIKYVSLVVGYIILFIIIIIYFSEGEFFDLDYAKSEFLKSLIICKYEEDMYYYFIFNRLIYKSNNDIYHVLSYSNINSIRDVLNKPKFKLKSEMRKGKIKKIL